MEDLTVLGNAAVVPIIIFLTQFLKKNFKFPYRADVLALLLALVVCTGWEIYNITPEVLQGLSAGFIVKFRFGIDLLVTSFATWLAASKIYDLGHGTKKRAQKVELEKRILSDEIIKLRNGNGNGDDDEKIVEDPEAADKLRNILEER